MLMNREMIELITKYSGRDVALQYRNYHISDYDLRYIKSAAEYTLEQSPDSPGNCASMNAVLAIQIIENTTIPTFLVAGRLVFKGCIIFGGQSEMIHLARNDFKLEHITDNRWDGHIWIVAGDYVIDISFLHTACAESSPGWLKQMMVGKFDPLNRNQYILCTKNQLKDLDLHYKPQRILNGEEIESLVASFAGLV